VEISLQKSEQRSSRKRYDGLLVPVGLGLSEDAFRPLMDDWIVPRLVQTLVEQGATLVISRCFEKKPISSVSVISPSRIARNQERNISRTAKEEQVL
jgi:hypothetical protein